MSQQTGKSPNRLISRIENIGQRVGHGLRSRFKQNAQKNNRPSATGSSFSSTSGRLPTSTTSLSVLSQGSGATSSLQVPSSIQLTGSSTSISSGHSSSSVPTTAAHTVNVKPSQPLLVAPLSNSTAASPSIALLNHSQNTPILQSLSIGPSASLLAQPVLLQPADINAAIAEIRKAEEVIKQRRDKWRYTNRHGKEVDVVERIGKFLRSLDQCAKIVDIGIQHNPEITSLVWAGLRFILMVAFNTIQYIEEMEAAMATMVQKIAICEFYAHIYEGVKLKSRSAETAQALEEHLNSALKELYKAVQAFLDEAKQYYDPLTPAFKKVKYSLMPFSVFMGPFIEKISQQEKEVEACAQMATMERIVEGSESLKEMKAIVDEIKTEMGSLTKLDEIIQLSTNQLQMMTGIQDAVSDIKDKLAMVKTLEPLQVQLLSSTPLDTDLQQLRKEFLTESERSDIYEVDLYVPTQGMPHPHSSESEYFDLTQRIDEFLADSSLQRVCLIQGAAGSGKSTFTHHLARTLWSQYYGSSPTEQATLAVPLFMSLTSVHDPASRNEDLIEKFFQQPPHKWNKEKIEAARDKLSFVFILDGYDEIERRDRNFYIDNKLGHWKAKVILTSRPEYLEQGYQSKFYPSRGQQRMLQEYWMAPFSPKSIEQYISSYVQVEKARTGSSLSVEHYKQLLSPPEVQALISNPFLLRMVMTVQSALDRSQVQGKLEVKRVFLYRQFLNHWYSQAQSRLDVIQLPEAQREAFSALCYDDDLGFQNHVQLFCQRFALALYERQMIEATYELPSDDYEYDSNPQPQQPSPWKHFLTNSDQKIRLLRYSSPLARNQRSYRFIHKSLRDFIVAQSLWNDRSLGTPQARINKFHIVDDPGVLDFVVEQAESAPILQDKLLAYVEQSKKDPLVQQAATNAITILVRVGKPFGEHDLRGVRIPHADLSYGWFERARLEGSDLRQTRMQGIWLREANLRCARMDGVWFGEKPYNLLQDSNAYTCLYLPGGELLIGACSSSGEPEVWSINRLGFQLRHTFDDFSNKTTCEFLSFSSDGTLLASPANRDVKVWDITNRTPVCTFEGHEIYVTYATFSPGNQLLISGDRNGIVRLWSVVKQCQLYNFDKISDWTKSIAFSPDGKVFALGDAKKDVTLWSVPERKLLHTFSDHTTFIFSVAFSPDGQILASGDKQGIIRLWSFTHKKLMYDLVGHTAEIIEVTFSPDGYTLASTSNDGTLRLWSVANQSLLHVYHTADGYKQKIAFSLDSRFVASFAETTAILQLAVPHGQQAQNTNSYSQRLLKAEFSPDGELFATHDENDTLSLWSVSERRILYSFNENSRSMRKFAFSPDGKFLVLTGSSARLWSILERRIFHTFTNQSKHMLKVTISPDGELVALINETVRLWSVSEGRILNTITEISQPLDSIAFSPNGEFLALGDDNHTVHLWSIPECHIVHTFTGHSKTVKSLAFSPDSSLLVSGSSDGTVRLWSVSERRELYTFVSFSNDVSFSPNGDFLTYGCNDKTVNLCSVPLRKTVHKFTGLPHHIVFSPQGEFLGVGNSAETVTMLSAKSRDWTRRMTHRTGVMGSDHAFSPDGQVLATLRGNNRIILWSVYTRENLFQIELPIEFESFSWGQAQGLESNKAAGHITTSNLSIVLVNHLIQIWQVRTTRDSTAEELSIEVCCLLSTDQGRKLRIDGTNISDVKGLDPENLELLRQHGSHGLTDGESESRDAVAKLEQEREQRRYGLLGLKGLY